jgi:hypothetical protein
MSSGSVSLDEDNMSDYRSNAIDAAQAGDLDTALNELLAAHEAGERRDGVLLRQFVCTSHSPQQDLASICPTQRRTNDARISE